MRKKILFIFMLPLIISCTHCSVTTSNFDGKTRGINPYGKGNVKVTRTSYWGNIKCILKLVDQDACEVKVKAIKPETVKAETTE